MFRLLIKKKHEFEINKSLCLNLNPYKKSYYYIDGYAKKLGVLVSYGEGGSKIVKFYWAYFCNRNDIEGYNNNDVDLFFSNLNHINYKIIEISLLFENKSDMTKFKLIM